ncbi:MAG TPA: VWA domain-containing protein [Melioribacteraceae bacterium]|nr:VWA domain-containing protein [Melioribacteraceae bacterium]
MFRFGHTEYLLIIYFLPVLILLFWYFLRLQKQKMSVFANSNLHSIVFSKFSSTKAIVKFAIFFVAVILIVLSLCSPQIGDKLTEVKQTGIDVFILLDVSKSMKATDIQPNRLDKAKFDIYRLIQTLKGDRIGLIIFSGQPYVQFPLTTDYSAANLFLNAVDENSVPQQGTAIADAIKMALSSFKYEAKTQKAIIIITDGEDHEGDIDAALEEANKNNIKVFTIGLGSPSGSPIPINQSNDFKRDKDGNIVITKLNEDLLKEIATKGNGKYFLGASNRDDLEQIYSELAKIEKTEYGMTKVIDYEDKYFYLLIPALLLLILEGLMTNSKSKFFEKLFEKRQ